MDNRPYPFIKNRYYNGKLLNARDFQNEQQYLEDRFSLTNGLLFGYGIVSGLRVQKIDGESFLLEPGCCVDGRGRMLVADRAGIKKIRALPGFSSLSGGTALLRMEYGGDPMDPVFSALSNGENQTEYNTEKETYSLFLEDAGGPAAQETDGALLSRTILYSGETLRVTQFVPRYLSRNGITRVLLHLESTAPGGVTCSLRYRLDTPGFLLADSGQELNVSYDSLQVSESGQLLSYSLVCEKGRFQPDTTVFTLAPEDFSLSVDDVEFSPEENFREEFFLAEGDMESFYRKRLQSLPLDEAWDSRGAQAPVIATVRFIRSGTRCMIDEILPPGPECYANSPFLFHRADRLLSFYAPAAAAAEPVSSGQRESVRVENPIPPAPALLSGTWEFFRSGTAELPAGLDYRPGTVLRTDEIVHGLGPGQVYVDFGLEDLYVDAASRKNRSEVILGDNTLFNQVNGEDGAYLEKAVKLLPDRGTFFLAVRSHKKLRQPVLRLRWYAWLLPEDDAARTNEDGGALLGLRPETVTVRPGEVVRFEPVFREGAELACHFGVEDRNGGHIDASGLYTAPPEEGCFMVSASSVSDPDFTAYSFVLVKKEDCFAKKNGETP